MMRLILLLFVLLSQLSYSQNPYRIRAEKNLPYLVRDSSLYKQININEYGVFIYAPDNLDYAETKIQWSEVESFLREHHFTSQKTPSNPKKNSLKGIHIALDPGHFANNMETAILERKFMKIDKKDTGTKKDIAFYESDLAWNTAYILSKRLEAKGCNVLITRKKGKTSFGMNFKKWKKKSFKKSLQEDFKNKIIDKKKYDWYLNEATDKDIAKYLNRKDLMNRAKIINEFEPHLTINIHYNASSDRTDANGNFPAIKNNYCMAFTGGGFMKNELNSKEARMNFLRLLLSEDLEQSILFSSVVMKYHQSIAKVPVIPNKNNLRYLQKNSVYADQPGVYCRNLGLTRRVKGTICFGESLMQDNINEAVLLNLKNYKEAGIKTSSRIKLVVDAFEAGIWEYLGNEE